MANATETGAAGQRAQQHANGDRSEFRRELGQQLRVDSIRASAAAGSGHPTSSMSAADLMAVLLDGHLRLDYSPRPRTAPRPPDLLQGPRVAAVLRDAQGGGRDRRRGAAQLPPSRLAGSRATRRRRSRRRTSRPARSARVCRSASGSRSRAASSTASRIACGCSAATPRWPRARSGRRSSTPAGRARQPHRDRRRQPARSDAARRCSAGTSSVLRRAREAVRLARDRRSTATTSTAIDGAYAAAERRRASRR